MTPDFSSLSTHRYNMALSLLRKSLLQDADGESRTPLQRLVHHVAVDLFTKRPLDSLGERVYRNPELNLKLPTVINCVLFYIVPLLEIRGSSCSTPMCKD